MKSLLMVVLGLLLISSVASADLIRDDAVGGGTRTDIGSCALPMLTITQQVGSPIPIDAGTFSCGNILYSYIVDAWELRRFSLYWDNSIVDPFQVHSVEWGVRRYVATDSFPPAGTIILPYNDSDPDYIVDVNLYCINGDSTLTWANMGAPLATVFQTVPKTVPPVLLCNTPMSTLMGDICVCDPYVDPVIKDLVVGIHYPATYTYINPVRFAIAASTLPETAESYSVFTEGCAGFTEPSTPTQLGSPGASKFALAVCGSLCVAPPPLGACCDVLGACTLVLETLCVAPSTWNGASSCAPGTCPPVPTQTKSWGQVKSLYR